MPGWVTCPACNLKHTARPDGICPRCKTNLAAPAAGSATAESTAPQPGPPPGAPQEVASPAGTPPALVPAGPPPALQASARPPLPPAPTHAAAPPAVPAPPAPVHIGPIQVGPAHAAPVAVASAHAPAPAAPHAAPAHAPAPAAPHAAPAHAPAVPAPDAAAAGLVYPNEPPLFGIVATISILAWLVLVVGTLGVALVWALLAFVIYLFAQSALVTHLKGTAIRITPRQFPDLHARLLACCERLGMARVPDCYLLNGQGGFNAFAARFLGRNFVVLFSDVVDALEDRPGAVDFYIGHELAHIQRGHLSWAPVLMPGNLLPLLGAAYHRACESSCDRYGAACCKETQDAIAGITALAAGHKRWKGLSVEEYVAQGQESRGFWMSFHELLSDSPWLVKRVARVIAFQEGRVLVPPARNPLAYLFALFVPRMVVGGGAGIVSLLAAVAIIGVVAAIAIPTFLRARVSANESAVIGEVRAVASAQAGFGKQHGRFTSLACLAAQPSCVSLPANPPTLVAAVAATEVRHDYRFQLDLDTDSAREFVFTAVPLSPGRSGVRSFCADSSGMVYESVDPAQLRQGGRIACNPGLVPLGGS
jgi:Zn-dependent protease with chaperone function/type II secretory pathway pseudopilin PulG